MLDATLVGRTLRHPYSSLGETITITQVYVHEGKVYTVTKPNTGDPERDSVETVGSLAPGTVMWSLLAESGPAYDSR